MPGDTARQNGKRGGRPKGRLAAKTIAKRRGYERALTNADITAERVMLELARLATTDRRGVWDADGRLKPLDEWTPEQGACLEGLEVIIKNAEAGDGHVDKIHKVKLATKHSALELLAKHFGLVKDKVDVTHRITLEDLIVASNAAQRDDSAR